MVLWSLVPTCPLVCGECSTNGDLPTCRAPFQGLGYNVSGYVWPSGRFPGLPLSPHLRIFPPACSLCQFHRTREADPLPKPRASVCCPRKQDDVTCLLPGLPGAERPGGQDVSRRKEGGLKEDWPGDIPPPLLGPKHTHTQTWRSVYTMTLPTPPTVPCGFLNRDPLPLLFPLSTGSSFRSKGQRSSPQRPCHPLGLHLHSTRNSLGGLINT